MGRDSSVGIATRYGWMVRGSNPGGGEIFRTHPDRPWGPPSLLFSGYRVFPGGRERPECDIDPSPLLVPRSRNSRAIPLFPLWTVRPVESLSACTRVHFYLSYIVELNDLYSSPNIVRVIKLRRMRWAGHVARMGEERGCIGSW